MSFSSYSRSYANKKTNVKLDISNVYNESLFGDRLKKLRTEMYISRKELALICEVTPSIISAYEVGRYNPSIDILNKLSNTFDMNYLCKDGYSNLVYNFNTFVDNVKSWISLNNYTLDMASTYLGISRSTFKFWFDGNTMQISTYNKIYPKLIMYNLIAQ